MIWKMATLINLQKSHWKKQSLYRVYENVYGMYNTKIRDAYTGMIDFTDYDNLKFLSRRATIKMNKLFPEKIL